jgi:hypothetical protein
MPVARAAGKRFALTFDSQAEKDAPAETGAPDERFLLALFH